MTKINKHTEQIRGLGKCLFNKWTEKLWDWDHKECNETFWVSYNKSLSVHHYSVEQSFTTSVTEWSCPSGDWGSQRPQASCQQLWAMITGYWANIIIFHVCHTERNKRSSVQWLHSQVGSSQSVCHQPAVAKGHSTRFHQVTTGDEVAQVCQGVKALGCISTRWYSGKYPHTDKNTSQKPFFFFPKKRNDFGREEG